MNIIIFLHFFTGLSIGRQYKVKGRANLSLNLKDDLKDGPVFSVALDSERQDLVNIYNYEDKKYVFIRAEVSLDLNSLLSFIFHVLRRFNFPFPNLFPFLWQFGIKVVSVFLLLTFIYFRFQDPSTSTIVGSS